MAAKQGHFFMGKWASKYSHELLSDRNRSWEMYHFIIVCKTECTYTTKGGCDVTRRYLMGLLSHMWSIIDWNVGIWHIQSNICPIYGIFEILQTLHLEPCGALSHLFYLCLTLASFCFTFGPLTAICPGWSRGLFYSLILLCISILNVIFFSFLFCFCDGVYVAQPGSSDPPTSA
jgi:hypothetical protein